MVDKDLKVGDLVWAKMRGFPYWPAQIENPKPEIKRLSIKKSQHYVFFFGSKNYAWILDEFIVPHSEEMVSSCSKKKKTSVFQSAVDEIVQLSKKKQIKTPLVANEENDMKEAPKRPSPANTETKAHEVQKKAAPRVVFPKKILKVQKKRKQSSSEMDANRYNSFSAKSPKKEDDYSALLTNVPPNPTTSRIAVIRPYDEEPPVLPSPGILQRAEYIERPKTPILDIHTVSAALQQKSIDTTSKKIGFLGIGMIGRGIVKNLLHTGHNVTIWNRSPERCKLLLEAGAIQGQTPADVVRTCDITFCCVSDANAVKLLVFGNCGVLKGLEDVQAGTRGYVEMTSMDSAASCEIGAAIIHAGGRYLEAPVCGSREFAEAGTLLILCAGDHALFSDCTSCFESMAKNAYYVGPTVGSGSKMNLIQSMFFGTTYAALAEAMSLAERCNLNRKHFLDILDEGPLASPCLLGKGIAMSQLDFTVNTALKYQQKDLNLALSLANSVEQPMMIPAAANEIFKYAKLLRYADHDLGAVLFGAKY